MSRPEKYIDLNELVKVMAFYPTLQEVASWFEVSPDTIERRVLSEWGMLFNEFRTLHAGKTRLQLKRKAIAKALEDDNEKMLIHCLRTMTDLDDREKADNRQQENLVRLAYTLNNLSDDEKRL